MFWSVVEAVALAVMVLGGFLLFGAWALIVGGACVLALSYFVNRKAGEGA